MSHPHLERDPAHLLDAYIFDYLIKRNLHSTASMFQHEGNVSIEPWAIDAPSGFLSEFWSVFWEIYVAIAEEKPLAAVAAAPQLKSEQITNRVKHLQKLYRKALKLIHESHALQQQNHATVDTLATKLLRLYDTALKQNILVEAAAAKTSGQPRRQKLPDAPSGDLLGNLQNVQNQHQQLLQSTQRKVDIDCLVDDGSSCDSFELLHPDDAYPRDRVDKGFSFKEIRLVMASTHKIECCHFSPDGKWLATGGHDKRATLWCIESFKMKCLLDEHSQYITDVRFSPSMPRIATSSADKTVKIWNVDNPCYSLRTFTGHSTTVLTLDFHPDKEDLIFSSDYTEIKRWSIKDGECTGNLKLGVNQMRFQPSLGMLLAAATEDVICIIDAENLVCIHQLQGHRKLVRSVCWDFSGEYLVSVSDDSVRIWRVSMAQCIYSFDTHEKKFNTCVFHPSDRSLLIFGSHKSVELWNLMTNSAISVHAHDDLVSSLAVSNVTGLVASASHDKHVKFWKT